MRVGSMGQEDPLEEGMATTPVFLPGESHGQRGLAGYSPQGHKELHTTEATQHTSVRSCFTILSSFLLYTNSISRMSIYIPSFLDFLPIQVTAEHGVAFSVLHRGFSLVTYFIHTINSIYIFQSQSNRELFFLPGQKNCFLTKLYQGWKFYKNFHIHELIFSFSEPLGAGQAGL